MANIQFSGSVYVDTVAQAVTGKAKVAYILYTSSAAADSVTFRDGTSGTAPLKCKIQNISATDTKFIDLSAKPLIFQNGIYCSAISAGSVATLILTSAGE